METSLYHLTAEFIKRENNISINMYFLDGKEVIDELYNHKDEIQDKVVIPLFWEWLNNKKASKIFTYIEGLSFETHQKYEELSHEMLNMFVKFYAF